MSVQLKYSDYITEQTKKPTVTKVPQTTADTLSANNYYASIKKPTIDSGAPTEPLSYEDFSSKYADYSSYVKAAEDARKASAKSAQVAYQQSKATYGAMAENLSQAGLSGSGYASYIDQQAKKTKADTFSKIKASYNDVLKDVNDKVRVDNEKFATESKATYADLLDKVSQGGYSDTAIDSALNEYGTYYGWNEQEQQAIKDTKADYKATISYDTGSGVLGEMKIGNADDISKEIDEGHITNKNDLDGVKLYAGDQYNALLTKLQTKNFNDLIPMATNVETTIQDLSKKLFGNENEVGMVANGAVSEEQATQLVLKLLSADINNSTAKDKIDEIIESAKTLSTQMSENAFNSFMSQANAVADAKKTEIQAGYGRQKQNLIDNFQAPIMANANSSASTVSDLGTLIDTVKRVSQNIKTNAQKASANTGASGVSYNWGTKTFSLGKTATVTAADGTKDEVYLSFYASKKIKDELGVGKEGQIKKASNGWYYVYDGSASWVGIKKNTADEAVLAKLL